MALRAQRSANGFSEHKGKSFTRLEVVTLGSPCCCLRARMVVRDRGRAFTRAPAWVRACPRVYVRTRACQLALEPACGRVYAYAYAYTYAYACVCVYVCVCLCVFVCVCVGCVCV